MMKHIILILRILFCLSFIVTNSVSLIGDVLRQVFWRLLYAMSGVAHASIGWNTDPIPNQVGKIHTLFEAGNA